MNRKLATVFTALLAFSVVLPPCSMAGGIKDKIKSMINREVSKRTGGGAGAAAPASPSTIAGNLDNTRNGLKASADALQSSGRITPTEYSQTIAQLDAIAAKQASDVAAGTLNATEVNALNAQLNTIMLQIGSWQSRAPQSAAERERKALQKAAEEKLRAGQTAVQPK